MLIEEMALYAQAQGHGTYDPEGSNGDIYLGVIPDTPDEVLSIFLRGGPERDPDNEYVIASVQMIVRSPSKLSGMTRAQAILNSFNGFSGGPFTDGGTYIMDCLATQGEPADIGHDDANRYEWSINYSVEYKRG